MKKANAARGKRSIAIQVTLEQYAELERISREQFQGLLKPATLAASCFDAGLKAWSKSQGDK